MLKFEQSNNSHSFLGHPVESGSYIRKKDLVKHDADAEVLIHAELLHQRDHHVTDFVSVVR